MDTTDRTCESLDVDQPIWDRFFQVAPLYVVGTRDASGQYNLAPKHLVMPLSWENYIGFVCAPTHATYRNVVRDRAFSMTCVRPSQIVMAGLAATPRSDDDVKASLLALPTFKADRVDALFLRDGLVFLECVLHEIRDGYGSNSLIAGRIVRAQVDRAALRQSEVDDAEIVHNAPLLVYLAPGRYQAIDESLAFPFPRGYAR